MIRYPLRELADLKPGDHVCCLYETEEEHRAVLTPFLREGLEQGQKVLYVVDAYTAVAILGYLRKDGVDVEPYLASGQLVVITSDDAYLRGGTFDLYRMIGLLRTETERAVAEGYPALRVSGEMTWILKGLPGSETFIEYEAKLNTFLPNSKCLALCQYDRRRFNPAVLLDMLICHPVIVVGTRVYENFYFFIGPDEFLGPDRPEIVLRNSLKTLAERRRVEDALQKARDELEIRVLERTADLAKANEQLLITGIRVKEEAEVAQRRTAELQATLDNMVDGVFVCDVEGRIILTNDAAIRLLGLLSPEDVDRVLRESPGLLRVRHPDGRPVADEERPLARAMAGETVVEEDEIVYNLEAQRDVYLRTSAAPIRDGTGKIVGAVAVARDVTEFVELDQLKDQFISVAAHELKTPVATMKGYAQALLRATEALPEPSRRMLEAISRGSDRIDGIVRDLLDISRLRLGPLELFPERIDLAAMVEEVVDRMALTTTKHRLRVERAEPAVIEGDRDRLEQVMAHLLENAIRYSPKGGDIDVEMVVRDGEAVVSVRDYGLGIPRDRQKHIFERFYRAHTGTPYDYGEMGVGLYISREIITQHGGRMWFESEEGKGSTFYFSVPLFVRVA